MPAYSVTVSSVRVDEVGSRTIFPTTAASAGLPSPLGSPSMTDSTFANLLET
jgi:hypothetical protein